MAGILVSNVCVRVLQFAPCMANTVPCCVGRIPCDNRGRMAAQVERSELTWIKQERAHSGTFTSSLSFFQVLGT